MTESGFDSGIWFSYKQKEYVAKKVPKIFKWTEKIISPKVLFDWSETSKQWDWKNCHFSIIGNDEDSTRVAVRRQKVLQRTDALSGNKISLMMGIDVTGAKKPEFEKYHEPKKNPQKDLTQKINRWAIRLTNKNDGDPDTFITDACIWMEADDHDTAPDALSEIFEKIQKTIGTGSESNVFDVQTTHDEHVFPVIYQPRVDTLDNYIRAIFWDMQEDKIEISIVFNDEQLSRAWFLDVAYRLFRKRKYGRIRDLESFQIMLSSSVPTQLKFPDIYSNNDTLKDDSTHGDSTKWCKKAPPHDIKYFYDDEHHPVVFVNTSNHAMAEHDTNPQFWKWEYVGWEKDTPLVIGGGTRDAVDDMLKEQAIKEKYC
ncbi:hypothetical protein [Nitrosopumilus piranensis]|nr:hypothetical protein [Nitrosopumilus piranensis]